MNSGLPSENWDDMLHRLGGPFLQSRVWAKVQMELGRTVYYHVGNDWCWLASLRQSRGLRYLMVSYGPVAADPQALRAALSSLRRAGSELGVDFIRFEPRRGISADQLQRLGATRLPDLDPAHTSVVDLSQTEAQMRAALSSGHRNLINGTKRRGITISADGGDVDEMLRMLHETAARAGVRFHADAYYRVVYRTLKDQGMVQLYTARTEEQPVAMAMFYDWKGVRYYAHAGAYQELNRKVKASVSLVWQAMLDAKKAGLQQFDLWGVAPEGDDGHHLASLSTFKLAFGGRRVDYLGTWDLPLRPLKYRLYSLYRAFKGGR